MIQNARSSSSQSLLREAESLIMFIEDENAKEFFQNALEKMIDKRKDPNVFYTGAKQLKEDLLTYLESRGEIGTVNIWVRKLIYSEADELLREANKALSLIAAEGVLELHLQDRQINSPHLQYVGTKTMEAEYVLAETVVNMGFEDSMQTAMSKNLAPAYITDEKLKVVSYDARKEEDRQIKQKLEEYKDIKQLIQKQLDNIHKKGKEFLEILNTKRENTLDNKVAQILNTKRENAKKIRKLSTEELIEAWKRKKQTRKK